MPVSDPVKYRIAAARLLDVWICRKCGARNPPGVTKCRRCRSRNLRPKKKSVRKL